VCSGGGRVPRGESRNAYCRTLQKRAKVVTKMECRNGGDCGKYTCGRFALGCWYPVGIAAGLLLAPLVPEAAGSAAAVGKTALLAGTATSVLWGAPIETATTTATPESGAIVTVTEGGTSEAELLQRFFDYLNHQNTIDPSGDGGGGSG
jgi:hypothetical protein